MTPARELTSAPEVEVARARRNEPACFVRGTCRRGTRKRARMTGTATTQEVRADG